MFAGDNAPVNKVNSVMFNRTCAGLGKVGMIGVATRRWGAGVGMIAGVGVKAGRIGVGGSLASGVASTPMFSGVFGLCSKVVGGDEDACKTAAEQLEVTAPLASAGSRTSGVAARQRV